MHRQPLLQLLRQHQPADAHEQTMTDATITFVQQNPDCFERSLLPGHITASALIVSSGVDSPGVDSPGVDSPDRQRVLMIHHRKLNRWLQPGGHADGNPDAAAVAMQESQEETGLTTLRFAQTPGSPPAIFDVDVHLISARAEMPEHLHYDIRFLLEADPDEPFRQNHETNDISWFTLSDASQRADSESVTRMIRKMQPVNLLVYPNR